MKILKNTHSSSTVTFVSLLGILFGVLTLVFNLFNNIHFNNFVESLVKYISADGTCRPCTPAMFAMLNKFIGTSTIILSVLLKPFTSLYISRSNLINRHYNTIIILSILFLAVLILFISLNRFFDHDEFEHIHSAWYVQQDYVPYVDFFQHHHPLLWYAILPILFIFGHSVEAVITLRIVMFGLTLSIAFLTYSITKKITRSRETSLISVLLLLSMVMFIDKSIEIRPDVPQVLFGLISIYYLINFFQTNNSKYIILSAFSASISFLFLQKSLFLLVAYVIIFSYKLLRRKLSFKSILYFAISFLLPLFFYGLHLIRTGSFGDYLLTNWTFNMASLDSVSPFIYLKLSFIQNGLFWLFAIVSIIFIFLSNKPNNELKMITFIGFFLLFSAFFVKYAYKQYYMFPITLLCVSIGYFIKYHCDRFRLHEIHRMVLIATIIITPFPFLFTMNFVVNKPQLEKIQFVIQNSKETDLVYDGDGKFNLYRNDLHYFWFDPSGNQGIAIYNSITDNKYGDYDICKLVKSKKPKFISEHGFDIATCGLSKFYNKTKYDHLYVRKE